MAAPEETRRVLSGRRQMAGFIGCSLQSLDKMIDRGILTVVRLSDKNSRLMLTTEARVLSELEREADRQQSLK